MAYIVTTSGCCHCKECWNLADVPHGTLGAVFTVRELADDGFEYHVIPGGFATRTAAEAAFKTRSTSKGSDPVSYAKETIQQAWRKIADHYRKLAQERADEGTSVQLACLVLSEYCVHLWAGDHAGPTLEMVALAENTVGDRLDEVVAAELTKLAAAAAELIQEAAP